MAGRTSNPRKKILIWVIVGLVFLVGLLAVWMVLKNNSQVDPAIDEGLNFYAAGGTNPMNPGGYEITEGNKISVKDDWFTAQIPVADGAQDFELSVTYSGTPRRPEAHLGISFSNASGIQQEFRISNVNRYEYRAELKKGYDYVSPDRLKSATSITDIIVKLKRVGTQYTFTYGTEEWSFDASDRIDGRDTFESVFATTEISDLRFYAYMTRGMMITDWSFTNLSSAQ